jgi:uncharacterized membrane protein YhaH (DUF805 family)
MMFDPLRKYATFNGRARRREYWLWQLFIVLLSIAFSIWLLSSVPPGSLPQDPEAMAAIMARGGPAYTPLLAIGLVSLALFLPSLAVSVRRLHDSDKTGWWILLGLTGIGSLVLFIFYLLDSTRGPNRFGPDPKGRAVEGR